MHDLDYNLLFRPYQNYIIVASTILYWDHAISFPLEIERVWKRKLSFASLLFVTNRYITFFNYIPIIYFTFDVVNGRGWQGCHTLLPVTGYVCSFSQLTMSAMMAMRTYALYGKSIPILLIIVALACGGIVTSLIAAMQFFGIFFMDIGTPNSGAHTACIPSYSPDPLFYEITWAMFSSLDILIFTLTVFKTYKISRLQDSMGLRGQLMKLILRDGSLYFAVMTLANIVNLIFFSYREMNPSARFVSYLANPVSLLAASIGNSGDLNHIISVTMMSRLFLSLRGADTTCGSGPMDIRSDWGITRQIRFALPTSQPSELQRDEEIELSVSE